MEESTDSGEKELSDSTLVDPSYVIHLIREMIPQKSSSGKENEDVSRDDPSAEAGCVLWDLAANDSIAALMVDNYILDVLLGILQAPKSDRIREIAMGILGNLAFHEKPGRSIAEKKEMIPVVVEQLLYATDAQTLAETCRTINVGLHGKEIDKWIDAMQSQDALERLLWIAENTLNEQLIDKVLELLLAMVDSDKKTAAVFLPGLTKAGMLPLLAKLANSQVDGIAQGSILTGSVLESLLQLAVEVSLSDEFSGLLADEEELKAAALQTVRLSWKEDLAGSAVTAMVLLANVLSQRPELAKDISEDSELVERLFALEPSTEDDDVASNALSSVLRRIGK